MIFGRRSAVQLHRRIPSLLAVAGVVILAGAAMARAADAPAPAAVPAMSATAPADASAAKPLAARRQEALAKGIAFLLKAQGEDGSWGPGDVGITALCTDALLSAGKTSKDSEVARALAFITKAQQADGSICNTPPRIKVYSTSTAIMALSKADAKAYADVIKKATDFLLKSQGGADESLDAKDPAYGGLGYDGAGKGADLSNTHFFAQALHDANVPPDNPAWQRLQVFLSRCQNRSESNDNLFPSTEDGGAIYTPVGGGRSSAGTVDLDGGRKAPKSYGSMTYSLYKSFTYANMDAKDPRVLAAWDWIRKNWTFEENPGAGQPGLYYYYMVAGKALSARGENPVLDARRNNHDWKTELAEAVIRRQRADGSWANPEDRWYEGEKIAPVPTSYCLMALAACAQ
jgi:squalene-hopene/tetraprenyl-beta-curcumene cyclase